MKKINPTLLILFLLFFSAKFYSQKNARSAVASKYGADSLAGFNFAGAMEHANEMKTDKEKAFFLNHAKRTYKIAKYNLYPQKQNTNTDNTTAKSGNNSTFQGPQPAGCTNIDFEAGNTSNWTVTGDNSIVTGGTDPYGGFPRVFPGGTASLKLNDDNTSGTKTTFSAQATRVIPVTAANSQFQLHFAFVLLNFPHPANAAANFNVYFLNAANTTVSCPLFTCYYASPPNAFIGLPAGIAQTGSNGVNIGAQVYPTTYVPWQTIAMDLTPYIGQNLTAVIKCNWCLYNYDWGYCYIDADCAPITPSTTAVCPGGQLCGPSGMSGYTWTPPAGPVVTTSCITASAIGTYTLSYTPFSTCGPATQTNTYQVLPLPTAGLTSANVCNSYTITNTGSGPPAVQSYSFAGPSPPASFTTTSATSAISFPTVGTYTIYQTVTNASGCKATATLVVVVPAGPNPAFTIPTPTQCLTGNSYVFTAVQAATTHTFSFNPTVGAPPTSNASTYGPVSFTAPGTYTVTHIITNAGCTASTSSVIVINPMPTVTATNNSPICVGGNVSFTSSGGGIYSWTGPNSFASAMQNPTITAITMPAAGIYTVNVNLAGCLGTATTQVSISTPTASANNTGPYCAGQTISLIGSAGTTYTWTGPSAFASNLQNPTIAGSTPAMSGTYFYTVDLGGCLASGSTPVVVNALPVPVANNTGPYCAGATIQLNSTAFTTYTWSGPSVFTSNLQNPTVPTLTSSVANAGVYTVTVTDANGCINTANTTVVVNPIPVPVIGSNSPICAGGALNLTSGGGTTYSWTGPNAFASALQNPNVAATTTLDAGIYTVTVTSLGCSNTATVNVVVSTGIASANNTGPYCAGQTVQLSANVGTSYAWTGPLGFVSALQNPNIPTASVGMNGVYTVIVSVGTCTASATTSITVNALPTPLANSNSPICIGTPLNFTGSSATTYTWTGPNSFLDNTQNPSIPTASINASGTYTFGVTDANNCTNTVTTIVVVNPNPIIAVNNPIVCANSAINLTANGGTGYAWSGPSAFASALQSPSIPNAQLNMSGAYTVTVTSAAGCTNTAMANVIVNPAPIPTINSNSPICLNDLMNFSATGGLTYQWNGPGGFVSSVQNPTVVGSSINVGGIYSVLVTDANSCSATATINTIVNPNPVPQITSGPNVGCAPLCVTYTVQSTPTASLAYWTLGNGESANGVLNAQGCYNTPGIYTITSTVTDINGCLGQATYTAEVYPKPVADFNHSPIKPIINIDGEVTFTDASWGAPIVSWNWYFMNTAQYTSVNQNTTFLYTEAGTYVVALVVKSDKGCIDTLLRPLVVGEDYGLYVPNAFTPNADGFNDVFQPKGFGIAKYELYMFDRWGEKVFHTKTFEESWDGTYQGRGSKLCEESVYTWLITVTDVFGKAHELKGHVTLIR